MIGQRFQLVHAKNVNALDMKVIVIRYTIIKKYVNIAINIMNVLYK